jgi:UDP:flavonoid glycosyltransferase YjiC (YdhE family)
MRVLFTSWAAGGHFAPLVPMGWALRAAGHEVFVACHPRDSAPIIQCGLAALPLGRDLDTFDLLRSGRAGRGGEPAPRGYAGMVATALRVAEHLAGDLLAFSRTWRPDLVLFEPASLIGPLVAQVLGIPAVRQLWCCDFTAPVTGFPASVRGELPARLGVTELRTAGDLTLDPCPPRLQVLDDLPRQPIRYLPYNGPAVIPGWLREPPARARLCLSWGTSLHGLDPRLMLHVPAVVSALGELDAEIVVAVTEAQRPLFTELPGNVRWVGSVPLHLLLPSCDAIVHQGGGGTLMTAATYGVPQVVVPSIRDQVFNAQYVAASGCGIHIPGGPDADLAGLVSGIVEVLGDPGYREAARLLRAECASRPTPAQVVPELLRLLAR